MMIGYGTVMLLPTGAILGLQCLDIGSSLTLVAARVNLIYIIVTRAGQVHTVCTSLVSIGKRALGTGCIHLNRNTEHSGSYSTE